MARMKLSPVAPSALALGSSPLSRQWLDRLADVELQHGHHATAERLANRAAELREAAR